MARTITGWLGTFMAGLATFFGQQYWYGASSSHTPKVLWSMVGCFAFAAGCFLFWFLIRPNVHSGTSQSKHGSHSPIGDDSGNRTGRDNSGIQSQGPIVVGDFAIERMFPKPEPVVSTPTPKSAILELKFSQGTIEILDSMVRFTEKGGKRCYLINVHNCPARDGEDAFRADSISARLTFNHGGEKTSFADQACWVDKFDNRIFLHPGETEHVLLGIADKESWITYANPNKYTSGDWPSGTPLREIRFPVFPGIEVPGEITIISNHPNRATTLVTKKFAITITGDGLLTNIRWLS